MKRNGAWRQKCHGIVAVASKSIKVQRTLYVKFEFETS